MTYEEYTKKLINASKILSDEILNNPSFLVEDLEDIRSRMDDLVVQLEFWSKNENQDRFCYELTKYIEWVTENYS
jgi:hypothetical protein